MDKTRHTFTSDELFLIEHWKQLKRNKKGYLKITVKSGGTQFFLEPTPSQQGQIEQETSNKY